MRSLHDVGRSLLSRARSTFHVTPHFTGCRVGPGGITRAAAPLEDDEVHGLAVVWRKCGDVVLCDPVVGRLRSSAIRHSTADRRPNRVPLRPASSSIGLPPTSRQDAAHASRQWRGWHSDGPESGRAARMSGCIDMGSRKPFRRLEKGGEWRSTAVSDSKGSERR
jgi:hypothetical protein